jgi:hypothetical protein
MNLKSFHYVIKKFVIPKTFVDIMFLHNLKIEFVLTYSKFHQMLSNLL